MLDKSDLPLVAYDRAVRAVVRQDGVLDKALLKTKLTAQLSALGVPSAEADMLGGFLDGGILRRGGAFGRAERRGLRGVQKPGPGRRSGVGLRGISGQERGGHGGRQEAHRRPIGAAARGPGGHRGRTWATPPNDEVAKANWWVESHAYTVLDYDETAQAVTLRNPWAAKPDPDGVFTPLADFLDSYESYTYSQAAAQ